MKSLLFGLLLAGLGVARAEQTVVRIGDFPNITHAQAFIAHATGWFEKKLGPNVKIGWCVYNARPSAMEAILADSIDLTYAGPSPALNAYSKSSDDKIRIIAGAVRGGDALVVQPDGRIKVPADFKGNKVETPQLGNTQDVECRAWLAQQGFKVTQLGGEVTVLPTANPDQLNLFPQGNVDAVWIVEPWVLRLENEAGAKVFLERNDSVTTVFVSSAKILRERRDLAKRFAQAHAELTVWTLKISKEAQKAVRDELTTETPRPIPAELVAKSWKRLTFSTEISRAPSEDFVKQAQAAGFMRGAPDLKRLIEIP